MATPAVGDDDKSEPFPCRIHIEITIVKCSPECAGEHAFAGRVSRFFFAPARSRRLGREAINVGFNCAEPNCDRIFSRIKAVWIRPRTAPVSRIVEDFGGGWRAGVGRGYDAKEKADRDRDRLHRRDRNRLSVLNGIRGSVRWQSAFSSLATGPRIVPTVASGRRRRCGIRSRA